MLRILASVVLAGLAIDAASAQAPVLPDGSDTHWSVEQPEELVAYVVFDPATVEARLPPTLRFITIGELAAGGVPWATAHLAEAPSHRQWGISFLEIARMGVFDIDGRAPDWPEHGAVALWLARVAPADSTADWGSGVPLLVLEFWVPDSHFVGYMLEKGYYATYGDVRLRRATDGEWRGSVKVRGLSVAADCWPTGPVSGGAQSRGMQVLFPPKTSAATTVVRVAFSGHQIQDCGEQSSWRLQGTHALARGVVLGPSTFQCGYSLMGGVYRR